MTHRNTSTFYLHWFSNSIIFFLIVKYSIHAPAEEFGIDVNAISAGVIMLFKCTAGQNPILLSIDPTKLEIGQICFSTIPNNDCHVCALFKRDVV